MARIARVVAPGLPHDITQRGNRRQATFFGADDDRAPLRTRSRPSAAMNGVGTPWGLSQSSWRLRGRSARRSSEENQGRNVAGPHRCVWCPRNWTNAAPHRPRQTRSPFAIARRVTVSPAYARPRTRSRAFRLILNDALFGCGYAAMRILFTRREICGRAAIFSEKRYRTPFGP
jgi:hypothetical protein